MNDINSSDIRENRPLYPVSEGDHASEGKLMCDSNFRFEKLRIPKFAGVKISIPKIFASQNFESQNFRESKFRFWKIVFKSSGNWRNAANDAETPLSLQNAFAKQLNLQKIFNHNSSVYIDLRPLQ